jgi:Ser/Thr protein kinase RdoA (MazF antagonist)
MHKREIESLLEKWDIGELVSCKQARKGVVNINWILRTKWGKYVLRKVTQFTSIADLRFGLSYLSYLKTHGFPYSIPFAIRTRDGRSFLTFKGSRFWVYEFIDGRDIKRFGYHELRECAKMMATYHKIIERSGLNNGKGKGDAFNRRSVLNDLKRFRKQILRSDKQRREDQIFLKESTILTPLIRNLDDREYSKLPRYPLHRDINPENILWKDRKLVGLIDFENVGAMNDTVVKDVSIMLQYACRDMKQKHRLDTRKASFFVREYKKHRQLSDPEIQFLPDIIIAGSIEDFCYAYWMLVNDPKRAKLYRLKLYSQVAQWYHKNKVEVIEKLKNARENLSEN